MLCRDRQKLAVLDLRTSATVGILTYAVPERLKDFPYREKECKIGSEIRKWLSQGEGGKGNSK